MTTKYNLKNSEFKNKLDINHKGNNYKLASCLGNNLNASGNCYC